MITPEQSAAYYEHMGMVLGEDPPEVDEPPACSTCDGLGCPDCTEEHDRDRLDDR